MLVFGTRKHSEPRRRALPFPDGEYFKSEWMECGKDAECSPTVFLVEQPPNTAIPLHFHRQNQFQLFVAGSGTIGKHDIHPVTVHYAGAYTAYGPLLSGPDGLSYFTIRPVFEAGALVVSESRSEMRKGPKRFGQSTPMEVVSTDQLRALQSPTVTHAIEPSSDGLAATIFNLPPAITFTVPLVSGAESYFIFVLAGTLHVRNNELAPWESAFISGADAEHCDVTAGVGGVQIVALATPVKAAAYR